MSASMELKAVALRLLQEFGDDDGFFATGVPGLTVMRFGAVTLPQYMMYRPSLCLIIQGAKETMVGETSLTYREGQALIITVDIPAIGRISGATLHRPYIGLGLEFDVAELRDVIDQMTAPPSAGGDQGFGFFVEETAEPLFECVLRLIRMSERPDALTILKSSIMRELFYWLLSGPNGGKVARLAIGSGAAQRITNAIRFIRDFFASPISIERLAEIANMSPSSLHQHFKALTSMTPLQFQKQLRLIEARRLLTAGGASVADAAFKVGYESASQFSREYGRMFGSPPARDVLAFRRRLGTAA